MQQTSETLRTWFRRVEPVYPELFNAAHAMCGSYDLAEYAVDCAILEVWSQNAGGGMGLRERLRGALRQEVFDLMLTDEARQAEFTWPGFAASEDALISLAARERIEVQRLLMLRYGCGLSPRSIARLTDLSAGQVRTAIDRFLARCRRSLGNQDRARIESAFTRRAAKLLTQRTGSVPAASQAYRAFEAEAAGRRVSGHRVSRAAGRVLLLLIALICAGAFWLFAVLVHPGADGPAPTEPADPPAVEAPVEEASAGGFVNFS